METHDCLEYSVFDMPVVGSDLLIVSVILYYLFSDMVYEEN